MTRRATQKAGNRWLDRAGFYGTQLTLCTTEAMFAAEYKRMTKSPVPSDLEWCSPGCACRHLLQQKGNRLPAQIICIDGHHEDIVADPLRAIAFLAHEVTHVKQTTMRVIGETTPSDEFEAYFIQHTLQNVLDEFARQMGYA